MELVTKETVPNRLLLLRVAVQNKWSVVFPSQRLTGLDYFGGGVLLFACWISFWHSDIWATGWDSLNYLFGKPLEFYDNCNKTRGLESNYPPPIYISFALWLYPFKLFHLVKNASSLPHYAAYWLKLLTTLVYLVSGVVFYKITQIYSSNNDWCKYAAWLWLVSPLALFSEFIFSQYDIFYVVFGLAGLLMFLRQNPLAASACFGVAVTYKYFPAFAFIFLLLLLEKRLSRILICLSVFSVPTLLIHLAYDRSPAFVAGVKNYSVLSRVYAAFMTVGEGRQIFYLFASLVILGCWCYVTDVSKEQLPGAAAYVYLLGSALPFLFIHWHPQWVMCFAPGLILTSVIHKRSERFLLFDLAGMLFFVAFISFAFHDDVDAILFHHEYFGIDFRNTFKMAQFFNWFEENSANVFLSAFWGYLAANIFLKFRPSMEPSENVLPVDYGKVRSRFYVGLLLFVLPASLAIYKDVKHRASFITNEVSGKHYGELTQNRSFEQSFIPQEDGYLNRVDLLLATFARRDSGSIVFSVWDGGNRQLTSIERQVDLIRDNAWEEFDVGHIKVAKGMQYRIRLTAPAGQPGNAITWMASEQNSYPDGSAIVDGAPQQSDFAFRMKLSK